MIGKSAPLDPVVGEASTVQAKGLGARQELEHVCHEVGCDLSVAGPVGEVWEVDGDLANARTDVGGLEHEPLELDRMLDIIRGQDDAMEETGLAEAPPLFADEGACCEALPVVSQLVEDLVEDLSREDGDGDDGALWRRLYEHL